MESRERFTNERITQVERKLGIIEAREMISGNIIGPFEVKSRKP